NPGWSPGAGFPYAADPAVQSIDAIWNSDGASCVTRPRLSRDSDLTSPDNLELWNSIMNECLRPDGSLHTFGTCVAADAAPYDDSSYTFSLNPYPLRWPLPSP